MIWIKGATFIDIICDEFRQNEYLMESESSGGVPGDSTGDTRFHSRTDRFKAWLILLFRTTDIPISTGFSMDSASYLVYYAARTLGGPDDEKILTVRRIISIFDENEMEDIFGAEMKKKIELVRRST